MDFVVDSLYNGHRFRALMIVDNFSRECLAIEAGQSLTGAEVAAVVERLVKERGAPDRIQCDNGSEFISRVLDKWAYENGVAMDFSRPGKPMDNAMIESFNGTFRDECLNVNWFLSMEDAREKIEKWREEYNRFRPHSALEDLTPQQFVDKFARNQQSQKASFWLDQFWGEVPHFKKLLTEWTRNGGRVNDIFFLIIPGPI
jgi:putative transposase